MPSEEHPVRASHVDCSRCGDPIRLGQRREATDSGPRHAKCADEPPTSHLRLANRLIAESISEQHDLTDRQIWSKIEDARVALRNAGRELDDAPNFPFCRSCGRPGRDYRG